MVHASYEFIFIWYCINFVVSDRDGSKLWGGLGCFGNPEMPSCHDEEIF
jgi:hypothetical protein